jgi:1-deoxy-D-xylulose-5-phosphate synthase
VRRFGGVDVLYEPAVDSALDASIDDAPSGPAVLLVAVGAFGELGVAAAERLAAQGVAVTVVDPRWVLPVPGALVELAAAHQLVVTVSDSGRHGGFGSVLADALRAAESDVPLRDLALPQEFLDHGNRADVLAAVGLTAQDVARRVTEWAAALPEARLRVAGGRRARRVGSQRPGFEYGAGEYGPGEYGAGGQVR